VEAFASVDRRERAGLAAPASTLGGQLERIVRNSMDSSGRKFVKKRTQDVYGAADCQECNGNGSAETEEVAKDGVVISVQVGTCEACGGHGKLGTPIGKRVVEYLPCKDDSAAHNVAHRTDEKFADHGADLMVWASLEDLEREVLTMQRSPVLCPGGGQRAARRQVPALEDRSCRHETTRALDGLKLVRCTECTALLELNDKGVLTWWLVCRACELPEEADPVSHVVRQHVRRIRVKVERRLSERREGDGSELIKANIGDGYCLMYVYEPVKRHNDDIAEELGISARQLRRLVVSARRKIAVKLGDEPNDGVPRETSAIVPQTRRDVFVQHEQLAAATSATGSALEQAKKKWSVG
jgi:hypothetical protein